MITPCPAHAAGAHARTIIRRLSLLLPITAMLALAACGGSGDKPSPAPAPPPEPHTVASCKVLSASPSSKATSAFLNAQAVIVYSAPVAGQCKDVVWTTATGNSVPTTTLNAYEWANPRGGVVGTLILTPQQDLAPATDYRLTLAGLPASSFRTGAARRGAVVDVVDQQARLSQFPETSRIDVDQINDILNALAGTFTHGYIGRKAIKEALAAELPALAHPGATYAARVRKLTYTSADADGNPVTLSGLLVLPESQDGSPIDLNNRPLMVGQRGAIHNDAEAPSSGGDVTLIPGLLAAGKGQIFFVPDLIGTGDSQSRTQAYLIATSAAIQTQDMLLAVRDHLKQVFNATPGQDLRMLGISQGAYSAMASAPLLSRLATIRQVAAAAGPYNVYQSLDSGIRTAGGAARDAYGLDEDLNYVADNVRYAMTAYEAYQGFTYEPSQVFAADGSLTPAFLQGYKDSDTLSSDFVARLGANSLIGTDLIYRMPQAQVLLYHFSTDERVPSQNTTDMLALLSNGNHQLAGVQRGNCHENSLFVKAVLTFSKSNKTRHVICVPFLINDVLTDL